MRKFFINLFFRLYEGKSYAKLNEKQIGKMFDYLTRQDETKQFGDFLRQCASAYKTKYFYNQDEALKATALAFIQLAEKFEEHTPKKQTAELVRQESLVSKKKGTKVNY